MNAIKGFARRATQSVREKAGGSAEASHDEKINDVTRKVRLMEKAGVNLSDKVLKVARLMGELGTTIKEVGDEFKQIPDLYPEMTSLADETLAMGQSIESKCKEFQQLLKEQAFDPLGAFLRELPKLKDAEEDRRKKQLEYDFFKKKVMELRRAPPKDTSRIPRNEGILENWRKELHGSTESLKVVLSNLYAQGQRALDGSVLATDMTVANFAGYTAALGKQHLVNARLPMYNNAPVLGAEPLPPNPLKPYYAPGGEGGVPANADPNVPPGAYQYSQPGQAPPGQQPPQQQQQPAWQQQPQQQPGQQPQQQYNNAPAPLPSNLSYGYGDQQQQQQQQPGQQQPPQQYQQAPAPEQQQQYQQPPPQQQPPAQQQSPQQYQQAPAPQQYTPQQDQATPPTGSQYASPEHQQQQQSTPQGSFAQPAPQQPAWNPSGNSPTAPQPEQQQQQQQFAPAPAAPAPAPVQEQPPAQAPPAPQPEAAPAAPTA